MKKIFTLLAFLVVTANAAAQGDPNNPTCFDVASPVSPDFHIDNVVNYLRGASDNDRLNLCGYVFYFKSQPSNKPWNWIDISSISNSNKKFISEWEAIHCFKGKGYFFTGYSANSAYNNSVDNVSVTFNITGSSGIDVFLYHNTTDPGEFSITATPQDGSNNVLSISETLSAQGTYFPFLYGLDKTKSYKIELSFPPLTCFYEISFLKRDLRTYQTTVTDGVNWGTMYLDFPVTIPTNHPSLEVYTVEAATDNCCFLSDDPIIGTIPANTGVLLYEPVPDHNEIEFVETSELNLNTVSKGVLRGTVTEGFTVGQALDGQPENSKVLTLGKISDNVGFFIYRKNKSTETLAKYKAYLIHKYSTSTSNENVKGIYISDFDELTGIQSVEIENTESGNWYSLQGVQLNSRPTQRGIYLNNGKKVLVK